jgi:hypothetical protein
MQHYSLLCFQELTASPVPSHTNKYTNTNTIFFNTVMLQSHLRLGVQIGFFPSDFPTNILCEIFIAVSLHIKLAHRRE